MPSIYISNEVFKRLDNTKKQYCIEKKIGEEVQKSITHNAIISELLDTIGQ